MSFETSKGALLTTLREIEPLSLTTEYEDFRALNGGVEYAAVVQLLEWSIERDAFENQFKCRYHFQVRLHTRHITDVAETRAAQDSLRELVLAKLGAKDTLNGEVLDAMITGGSLDRTPRAVGGVQFLVETVDVMVEELRDLDA